MMSYLLLIADYLGTFAFALCGALKAKKHHASPLIGGMLYGFGGGFFLRDLLILGKTPSFFSAGMLVFAAVIPGVYVSTSEYYHILKYIVNLQSVKVLICVMDSMGIAAAIIGGVERGINFGAKGVAVISCGIVSCIGGGLISQIFQRKPLKEKMKIISLYRIYAIILVLFYFSLRGRKFCHHNLFVASITGFSLIDNDVRVILYSFLKRVITSLLREQTLFQGYIPVLLDIANHATERIEVFQNHLSNTIRVCRSFPLYSFHRKLA